MNDHEDSGPWRLCRRPEDRQIAFLASTAYFHSGDIGEAEIAESRDGRLIAVYLDDATGSYWACSAAAWERYVDEDLDYSLWCSTSDAYELAQDCGGTFFADLAPDMSPRDNWGITLQGALMRLNSRLCGILSNKNGAPWSPRERIGMMNLRAKISARLVQVRS